MNAQAPRHKAVDIAWPIERHGRHQARTDTLRKQILRIQVLLALANGFTQIYVSRPGVLRWSLERGTQDIYGYA